MGRVICALSRIQDANETGEMHREFDPSLQNEIFLLYFYLMKKMFAYNPEVFQWR